MKKALLVIDVQRGLFEAEPPPFEADAVIARINLLTAKARSSGIPVIFIHHEAPSRLEFGSDGWQLAPGLVREEGDFTVRKTTPDSFLRTELADLLAQWGTEQLIICGYATEYCVDTTTRCAAARGFPVHLVADAHTTGDKTHASAEQIRTHHNATLSSIKSFGSVIQATPLAQLLEQLEA